jgi:hypothetical protein
MCLIPGRIASIAHQITWVDPRAFVAMVVVFCEIKPGSYSPQSFSLLILPVGFRMSIYAGTKYFMYIYRVFTV